MTHDRAVARQCTAISKGSGKRCRRAAIHGATVCRMHGGAAPQVKAAAARRVAEAEAQQAAAQTYIRLTGQQPDNPLEALKQLAGRFHAIEQDLFARIAEHPDQMAALLPGWGAAASRYLDVIVAWGRAEPPRAGQAGTIFALLSSLPDSPPPQLPPARPQAAQEAPDELEAEADPPEPIDGLAVALDAPPRRTVTAPDGSIWEEW